MATGNVKPKSKDKQSGIAKFFREVMAEFKRISWPSKKDIKKASAAVAVVCAIYMVVVSGMDYIFQNLLDLLLKLK